MIALLADENFNNDIVRGVRRRAHGIDLLTVQDVGLEGMSDRLVVEVAVDEIVFVAECSEASDWQNQVQFLPF
jgi:hypothetical protein